MPRQIDLNDVPALKAINVHHMDMIAPGVALCPGTTEFCGAAYMTSVKAPEAGSPLHNPDPVVAGALQALADSVHDAWRTAASALAAHGLRPGFALSDQAPTLVAVKEE